MRNLLFSLAKTQQRSLLLNSLRQLSDTFRHTSNPTSYEDTFQFWIVNKFREEGKFVSVQKDNKEINVETDLNSTENSDLLNVWMTTKNRGSVLNQRRFETVLIDRIKNASFIDLMMIFDASISVYESKFTSSEIYRIGLSRLECLTDKNSLSVHHKLQCLYYCGLLKKSKLSEKLMLNLLGQISSDLHDLNDTELAILCVSLYKCSLKPTSNLSDCIAQRLKTNTSWLLENPSILTCFIKSLRHSQHYDDSLFDILIQNSSEIHKMDLISKIHLLVYFCDACHSDVNFITDYIKNILNQIDDDYKNGESIRIKDLDNLLWSASHYWEYGLDKSFNESCLNDIVGKFMDKGNVKHADIFNILVYCWILNLRGNIFNYVTKNNILAVKKAGNFKDMARVSILLTCISIEAPTILKQDVLDLRETRLIPKLTKYFAKRPNIEKLSKEIVKNEKFLGITDVRFGFPIPCLFIGGIMCKYHSKEISIELCDESMSYRGTDIPHGYLSLKQRLLHQLGIKYYLVQDKINDDSMTNIILNIKKWLEISM